LCSLRGLGSLEACAVIAVTIGHACLSDSLARSLARLTASAVLAGLSANALARRCTARGTVASANVSPIHCTCDRDRSRTYVHAGFRVSLPRLPPRSSNLPSRRAENFAGRARESRESGNSRRIDVGTFLSLFLCTIADSRFLSEKQVTDCLFILSQANNEIFRSVWPPRLPSRVAISPCAKRATPPALISCCLALSISIFLLLGFPSERPGRSYTR